MDKAQLAAALLTLQQALGMVCDTWCRGEGYMTGSYRQRGDKCVCGDVYDRDLTGLRKFHRHTAPGVKNSVPADPQD